MDADGINPNQIKINEVYIIQSLSKQISDMSMKIAMLEACIQQLTEERQQQQSFS